MSLFIPPLAEWPADPDLLYLYWERVGMKFDSGTPHDVAEQEALFEVWTHYTGIPRVNRK